jgi:hypothetical protein
MARGPGLVRVAAQTDPPLVFRKDRYFEQTGYHPHPPQAEVHWDVTRNRALSNGRRWGKTLLGGKETEATAWVKNWLGKAQQGWIIGPQYLDCEKEFRVVYDSLKALGVEDLSTKFLHNVENGNMHIHTKWGWDLQARSAAHPETLVGEGLDFVLMVEAGRLRRSTFTQYVRPALSDKRGWSLASGVPELATDVSLLYWAWKRGQDVNRPTWRSWRKPSWTNRIVFPGGRNDPEILEAEEDLTEDEFRRQYGAEFVDRVGRVMLEWDDEVHLRNLDYNPNWPLYGAVDFGYTNPFVWLWIQVDEFNNVYVIGEHYITRQDVTEICDRTLVDHPWSQHLVAAYVDPHEPDDANILRNKLKRPMRNNTGGTIQTRNRMIRDRLKPKPDHAPPELQQAEIVVDIARCPKLAWEMREGYRWPEHKNEMTNESENPMDKDNHGPEALSRFIYGYFSVVGGKHERRSRASKANVRG